MMGSSNWHERQPGTQNGVTPVRKLTILEIQALSVERETKDSLTIVLQYGKTRLYLLGTFSVWELSGVSVVISIACLQKFLLWPTYPDIKIFGSPKSDPNPTQI